MKKKTVACAVLSAAAAACSDRDGYILDAQTLVVGEDAEEFPSIQAAIDSAGAGATIEVDPGVYAERVVIRQSLRLIGSESVLEPPAASNPHDPVIEVRGAVDVRIEGFTVRGPADGIQVRDSAGVVLAGIVASGNGDEGIDVRHSSAVEIRAIAEDNLGQGIQIRDGSENVTVHSSTIAGNSDDGIKIEVSTAVTVRSSALSGNLDGLKIEASADCVVADNEVTVNRDDGVFVESSTGTAVLRNTVTSNLGFGIRLLASPSTLLEENLVVGNAAGDYEID
jgi:parallel beta-helix repeat protein